MTDKLQVKNYERRYQCSMFEVKLAIITPIHMKLGIDMVCDLN